jgi:hypothetical protein
MDAQTKATKLVKKEEEAELQGEGAGEQPERSVEATSDKSKPIRKEFPKIIPTHQKREMMKEIRREVRLELLKKVKQQRKKEGKTEFKRLKVDFEPSEVLETGIFVHKTDGFVQLSMKPLYLGKEYFAINAIPCPQSTCDFDVLITQGTVRVGVIDDNSLKRIVMKNTITLCTMKKRLKIGEEYVKIETELGVGSRVRLMVCVGTRKFRLYINEEKEITCDFPDELFRSGRVYFYVELLHSGSVKILK